MVVNANESKSENKKLRQNLYEFSYRYDNYENEYFSDYISVPMVAVSFALDWLISIGLVRVGSPVVDFSKEL